MLAIAVVLGLGAAGLALRLRATAATNTLVSSSSTEYRATQRFYRSFGEEPIAVLVKGNLQQLVLSSDIDRLVGLEGCLSGNVPASALASEGGPSGPCGQLARAKTIKVVFGPGTFINEAANQIDEQLAAETQQAEAQAKQAEHVVSRAALARGLSASQARTLGQQASKITIGRFQENLVTLALEYGLTSRPSIEDPNFISTLVFDSSKPAGTPKSRFAYLFPSPDAALVSVRMKAGLSETARIRTIGLIRQAVAMRQWRLTHGESYLVTGEPVIVSDLTNSISHSIELLLVAVLLVMAGTLGLVFTGRPRLLPLALALLATALTFGALSAVGASLTMASIAVLPVLVGLAVDYAIQFQARVGEELDRSQVGKLGAEGPGAVVDGPLLVARAAAVGAPTIVTAGAASAAAMLVLLLSPVPMVRGFGVLLVVGVAIALLCALTVGAAAISLSSRARAPRAGDALVGAHLAAAWRGARELLADNPVTRLVARAALVGSVRHPGRVLCAGLLLAALGWGLDTQTKVETDITKLVPQNLSSLQNLSTLERITGVGGEIDLMVEGRDLTKPSTIEWMIAYQKAALARFGYSSARGCAHARLCPAFSLPDLFQGHAAGSSASPKLSQAEVSSLLSAIPPYFSQDVITPDRRVATLAFGIRLMGLDQQQRLIEQMRSSLHPPAGVNASLVGLPVLAAKSGSQVADPWRRLRDAARRPRGRRAGAVGGLPRRSPPRARTAGADRPGERMVGADPVRGAGAAEPDVGHAGRTRDRDLHRVQRAPVRAPPPGEARRARHDRSAATQLPPYGRRGRRVGRDGDRGLRRAGTVGHQNAPRLRSRDADRPERLARGGAGRASRHARDRRYGDRRRWSRAVSAGAGAGAGAGCGGARRARGACAPGVGT